MINKIDSKLQEFKRLKYKIDKQDSQNLEIFTTLAWEKARTAAKLLKKDFGVIKVILYGSLAAGNFKEGSDIDLLIFGFKGSFWSMYSQLEEIVSPIQVSLVCKEDASESLILEACEGGGGAVTAEEYLLIEARIKKEKEKLASLEKELHGYGLWPKIDFSSL